MPSESKYRDPHLINKLRKDIAGAKKYAGSQKLKTLLGQNNQGKPVEELEKELDQELLKPKAITEREAMELPRSYKLKTMLGNCFLCCSIYSEQVKKV